MFNQTLLAFILCSEVNAWCLMREWDNIVIQKAPEPPPEEELKQSEHLNITHPLQSMFTHLELF